MNYQSYTSLIRGAVRTKWPSPEQKERWYAKLSAARRRKTIKLFELQSGKCCFCEEVTFLDVDENRTSEMPLPRKRLATLEHKVTQKAGGTDHMANLAMACLGCNNARGTMLFEQFLEVRRCPVRWDAFLKRKAGIKGEPNSHAAREKATKRKAKRLRRLQHRAWQLALLFWLYPGLQPIFETEGRRLFEQRSKRRDSVLDRVMDHYG